MNIGLAWHGDGSGAIKMPRPWVRVGEPASATSSVNTHEQDSPVLQRSQVQDGLNAVKWQVGVRTGHDLRNSHPPLGEHAIPHEGAGPRDGEHLTIAQ
jgi:hypothetical protein